MIGLRPTRAQIFSSYWGILGHVTCLEQSCASEHRGILSVDARDEWNILSSAPFVIFERAAGLVLKHGTPECRNAGMPEY